MCKMKTITNDATTNPDIQREKERERDRQSKPCSRLNASNASPAKHHSHALLWLEPCVGVSRVDSIIVDSRSRDQTRMIQHTQRTQSL